MVGLAWGAVLLRATTLAPPRPLAVVEMAAAVGITLVAVLPGRLLPSAAARAAVATRRLAERAPVAVFVGLLTLGLGSSGHRASTAVGFVLTVGLVGLSGPIGRGLDRLHREARPKWARVDVLGGWAAFLLGGAADPNAVGTGLEPRAAGLAVLGLVASTVPLPTLSPTGITAPGFRPRTGRGRLGIVLCGLVVAMVAGLCFHIGVHRQEDAFNSDPLTTAHDQQAYTWYAHELLQNPDSIVANRNQVPAYPYLMGLFGSRDSTQQDLFRTGLLINELVGLAGAGLLGLYVGARASPLAGVVVGLIAGFGLFLMLCSWVLADVLAALLLCGVIGGLRSLLRRPSALRGGLVGLLAGVTQLTKPVALPIVGLFVGVVVLWMVVDRRGTERRPWSGRTAASALGSLLLLFGLVVLPYSVNTARNYGSAFYNQNTQYYLWYDNTTQAFGPRGTLAAGADAHRVTLPGGTTPSLSRYLATHSSWQVLDRFWLGTRIEWNILMGGPTWVGFFGYGPFVALLAATTLLAVGLNREAVRTRIRRDWPSALFLALVATSLQVSIAWFSFYGAGNRYLLPLVLPLLVAMAWCTQRGLARWTMHLHGRAVRLDRAALGGLLGLSIGLAVWAVVVNSVHTVGGY